MAFLNLITTRQSVRKYAQRPVEPEKLERCLEAARLAPSASNTQPWHFIVVRDEPLRTKVAEATFSGPVKFNRFTLQAPVLVVILLEQPKLRNRIAMILKNKEWKLIDIGITAAHFCLQAAEEGLGTCMMGWYDEKQLKKVLSLPQSKTVGLVISLGYAEDGYPLRTKIRKPMEEVVSYDRFQG